MNLLRTVPAEDAPLRPGLLDSGRKGAIPPISPCTASAPSDDVRFVVVIVTSILRGLGAVFAAARLRNPPTAPHDGSPSSSLKIGERSL